MLFWLRSIHFRQGASVSARKELLREQSWRVFTTARLSGCVVSHLRLLSGRLARIRTSLISYLLTEITAIKDCRRTGKHGVLSSRRVAFSRSMIAVQVRLAISMPQAA